MNYQKPDMIEVDAEYVAFLRYEAVKAPAVRVSNGEPLKMRVHNRGAKTIVPHYLK